MKKLIVILLLFISTVAFAKITLLERRNIDDKTITIFCIHGYKYVMVEWDFSHITPLTQMYRDSPSGNTPQPIRCSNE
jgi:hypothetical protein